MTPTPKDGSSISNRAFLYGEPSSDADLRMFCLPYAGRGASLYRRWWEASSRRIEFVPLQPPGRENRIRERPVHDLRELVESLAADIAPYTDEPYALFGYCVGATIAFELTHRLVDLTGNQPRHLIVAGCPPPHRGRRVSSVRERSDEELVDELRRLGGTPEVMLDNERFLAFAMPVLRADWSVVDGYSFRPGKALDIPVTVLGATSDPDVAVDDLSQWSRHTTAETRVHVFPGDHFFVERFQTEVRDLLIAEASTGPTLATSLDSSGRRAIGPVDTSIWREALRALDDIALTAMARAVVSDERPPATAQVEVASRHRWLLDRWIASLLAEGRVLEQDGALIASPTAVSEPIDQDRMASACATLGYGPAVRDFFLQCNANLPLLLRDKLTVQELWFEGGGLAAAEATYRDNPMARYLNVALAEALVQHLRNNPPKGPVRVLELGAGIGSSTSELVPALAALELDVRYVFSDVSTVFLSAARERFASYDFLEFELVDINDRGPSTMPAADVVVSANVLHNARDIKATLTRLRQLTADDGLFAFVESSREHYQIMASMLFMLSGLDSSLRPGSDDFRSAENRVCLTRYEWHDQLRMAGFEPTATVPDDLQDPMAVLEQYLYIASPTVVDGGRRSSV